MTQLATHLPRSAQPVRSLDPAAPRLHPRHPPLPRLLQQSPHRPPLCLSFRQSLHPSSPPSLRSPHPWNTAATSRPSPAWTLPNASRNVPQHVPQTGPRNVLQTGPWGCIRGCPRSSSRSSPRNAFGTAPAPPSVPRIAPQNIPRSLPQNGFAAADAARKGCGPRDGEFPTQPACRSPRRSPPASTRISLVSKGSTVEGEGTGGACGMSRAWTGKSKPTP